MIETSRLSNADDEKSLKAIWKSVFQETDGAIDFFFEQYFGPGTATLISIDEKPISMAHMMPIGGLDLANGEKISCSYIYAVATLPEYRGLGFGENVTKAALEVCQQAGYPVNVICPAEDSLFEYYKERIGYREGFFTEEMAIVAEELPIIQSKWGIDVISPQEYHMLREQFLAGRIHIVFDDRAMKYQKHLCKESGGEMYAIHFGGEYCACAAAEKNDDGDVLIKELLFEENGPTTEIRIKEAAALVSSVLPGDKMIIRMPCQTSNSLFETRRFGMIMYDHFDLEMDENRAAWFGFAFD